MDFNINTTSPITYQMPVKEQTSGESLEKNEPLVAKPAKKEIEIPKNEYLESQKHRIQEEFISDLKNMQNFLFVMIGSDLKLTNEDKPLGLSINRVA